MGTVSTTFRRRLGVSSESLRGTENARGPSIAIAITIAMTSRELLQSIRRTISRVAVRKHNGLIHVLFVRVPRILAGHPRDIRVTGSEKVCRVF